jgi:hypothetical protein
VGTRRWLALRGAIGRLAGKNRTGKIACATKNIGESGLVRYTG